MESEKVEEIKKALECMSGLCKDSLTSICFDCEIGKKFNEESACKKALTLINELESELEKEQINNLNCDTELQYKEKRIAELEKEKTCVWEEWTDGDHSIWCCSNCKEDFCFIEGDVYENNYGYCPHCGAKITALKELQEEEIDETLKEFIGE